MLWAPYPKVETFGSDAQPWSGHNKQKKSLIHYENSSGYKIKKINNCHIHGHLSWTCGHPKGEED